MISIPNALGRKLLLSVHLSDDAQFFDKVHRYLLLFHSPLRSEPQALVMLRQRHHHDRYVHCGNSVAPGPDHQDAQFRRFLHINIVTTPACRLPFFRRR